MWCHTVDHFRGAWDKMQCSLKPENLEHDSFTFSNRGTLKESLCLHWKRLLTDLCMVLLGKRSCLLQLKRVERKLGGQVLSIASIYIQDVPKLYLLPWPFHKLMFRLKDLQLINLFKTICLKLLTEISPLTLACFFIVSSLV